MPCLKFTKRSIGILRSSEIMRQAINNTGGLYCVIAAYGTERLQANNSLFLTAASQKNPHANVPKSNVCCLATYLKHSGSLGSIML